MSDSRQSGSIHGYKVEARVTDISPAFPVTYLRDGHPVILTDKWTEIDFIEGLNPAGVPVPNDPILRAAYLMDRPSAVALAYTFAAQNGRKF